MNAIHGSKRQHLLQERARFMRFNPTPSEALLWSAIRGKRLGVQFRRQQVVGGAIVDFLAKEAALIVEVDGDDYYSHRAAADAQRDRKLHQAGYRVVRVPASLLERDLSAAVQLVRGAL